ncbi:MAG: DUF1653 domain-containing protein [Rickettsiales bacterium]|jgi:hypothetical protein|nr:DUF1653 domain-containing protein [Rickettsiales bacterium]
MNHIKIGAKYCHFKGCEVRVLALAKDSETTEDMVVYLELADGIIWVRPLSAWFDQIVRPGIDQPRFTEIAE